MAIQCPAQLAAKTEPEGCAVWPQSPGADPGIYHGGGGKLGPG